MQFGSFLILLTGISDYCVAAINDVALLGMAPRHCTLQNVSSNAWIIDTPVQEELQSLDKFLKPYKTLRNEHVHAGSAGGDVGFLLRIFEVAKQHNLEIVSLDNGQAQFDILRARLAHNLGEVLTDCERRVLALLDALVPLYDKHSKSTAEEAPSNSA